MGEILEFIRSVGIGLGVSLFVTINFSIGF